MSEHFESWLSVNDNLRADYLCDAEHAERAPSGFVRGWVTCIIELSGEEHRNPGNERDETLIDMIRAVIGIWSHEYIYSTNSSAQFIIEDKLVTVYKYNSGLKFLWGLTSLSCSKEEIVDTCRIIRLGFKYSKQFNDEQTKKGLKTDVEEP